MGTYDDYLGSLLISSWFSSMLFLLIIRETIRYYTSFRSDGLAVKIFVAFAVLVDTASLTADYAHLYLYTVSHWGDKEFLGKRYWPAVVYQVTTGVTGLLVQSFLIHRYYTLTKNWLVAVFLSLCSLVSFGASMATVIITIHFTAYTDRFRLKIPVSMYLTMAAVTDVLIALALIWQLYHMKTSFTTTDHLIHRLMRAAMQTGSATSVIALCVLTTYLLHNTSNVPVAFFFILGRTYIVTLLYNLNVRKTSNERTPTSVSDHDYRSHRGAMMPMEGIHVQRTAVVHMDTSVHTSVEDLALQPSSYKSQRSDDKVEIV